LDARNARLLASAGGRQIAGLAARIACAALHHDKGLQEGMKSLFSASTNADPVLFTYVLRDVFSAYPVE
jgi:hypothetical protein